MLVVWLGLSACLYLIADDKQSQWDFDVYYSAAHALAAGGNPYQAIHPRAGLSGDLIFQYPPLVLYLFKWTTLLSLSSAKLVWLGLKLVALALLVRLWDRDFERLDIGWPIALLVALGFNSALLREFVSGNISTFEQLGLWFGFGLLLRDRPYAAAAVFAGVAQFKLLPVAFLGLIPLVGSRGLRDGWKACIAGCALFLALLALNFAVSSELTHHYFDLFNHVNVRMDDRGIDNPSSLALMRDLIDLSAYMPGLSYNQSAGTLAYLAYLVALMLVVIRAATGRLAKLRHADPRMMIYLGCALFAVAMPRMKDYSYVLMLIPALFVIRDLGKRRMGADYLLIGMVFMVCAQPQQTNVPGMTALVYVLQAYMPLFMAFTAMIYLLRNTMDSSRRPQGPSDPEDDGFAPSSS